jgi:hypothetical protein
MPYVCTIINTRDTHVYSADMLVFMQPLQVKDINGEGGTIGGIKQQDE